MAGRKEKYVTITFDNRDKGKTFYIKEMPASQAEWWAMRVIQSAVRSGIEIPDNVKGAGMAAVAYMGIKAFAYLPAHELKELMQEMFDCVRIVRLKENPETSFPLMEEDIEEVETRVFLRNEVFEVHTGFSLAAGKTNSTSAASGTESNTSTTQTSQGQ